VTGVTVGVLLLVSITLGVVLVVVVSHKQNGDREAGKPDAITDEVLGGVLAELRKWQAEAAHWKATAERLQRELDRGD
jgi:hypothetical protein